MLKNQELVRDWLKEKGIEDIYEKLCIYSALVSRWKDKYNIMGGDEDERWRLIGESLLAIDIIKGGEILDIGSGGGLPAIPIGIVIKYEKMVFVEPNERKAYILSEVIRELEMKNIEIYFEQIENFNRKRKLDFITMRGVPVIKRLLKVIIKLMMDDGTAILFTDKVSQNVRIFLERGGFGIYNKEHKISGYKGLLYFRKVET